MFYRAYGLRVRSEIALPELCPFLPGEEPEDADVTIRRTGSGPDQDALGAPTRFHFERQKALLVWPNLGAFRVNEGKEIVIEPAPGVTDPLLCPALLGSAWPILLLQRGLSVLHASAVALRLSSGAERAVAFLGRSGEGKSTMATALHKQGHRALCDDTIALQLPEKGLDGASPGETPMLIHPALPHLKLRAPSVVALGEDVSALARWHPDDDGFVLRLSPDSPRDPAPLSCLYVLQDDPFPGVELLGPEEALLFLMKHAYAMALLPDDELESHFAQCVRLAKWVRVFRLSRPRDFGRLPEVIRLVEEHQEALESLRAPSP